MNRYSRSVLSAVAIAAGACSSMDMEAAKSFSTDGRSDADPTPCGEFSCQPGFHCEFGSCVPNEPVAPSAVEGRDPQASSRYIFTLEPASRRLLRIDSLSLEVAAFTAGLAPMDLGVVPQRQLTVLLDGLDTVEILDHRPTPPIHAAWSTARALSHIRVRGLLAAYLPFPIPSQSSTCIRSRLERRPFA